MGLTVKWIDGGREPGAKPNPAYPNGVAVDATAGEEPYCYAVLPYPAKRCGHFVITCDACRQHVVVPTAGRPDDPRSLKLACIKPEH
jgi:hypothetical protein